MVVVQRHRHLDEGPTDASHFGNATGRAKKRGGEGKTDVSYSSGRHSRRRDNNV